ncbi:vacuolar iron transporter [Thozetella sp. PMI_491]|nr:vacuolar iron transporter [Thozetella sp. PMI_491]
MQATNSTGSILSPEPAIEKRLDRADMPPPSTTIRHEEKHTSHSEILRDIIIGFSDGLTVPFALTAGLSSLGDSHLVVIGGLAELFSGAISMGIGGYLAASTERQHYLSEQAREREEVICQPEEEREEIYGIMEKYGISREASTPLVEQLSRNPEQWVRFMMDFELRLEFQTANRAWVSAVAMGLSYFIGGLVPMIPYFALQNATHALFVSIGITAVILLVFGYIKSWITIRKGRATIWGAFQTLLVGAIAAGTSYGIVRALDSHSSS